MALAATLTRAAATAPLVTAALALLAAVRPTRDDTPGPAAAARGRRGEPVAHVQRRSKLLHFGPREATRPTEKNRILVEYRTQSASKYRKCINFS